MSHHGKTLGGLNIHGTGAKAKPPRSGKAEAMLVAAMRCGLTRRQAVELLAETLAVGAAVARIPAKRAELVADLERRTMALVVAVHGAGRARAELRGAA